MAEGGSDVQGFDPKFDDLPAFILGITEEIWEQRGVETLQNYYTDDIPVRSPDGAVIGNQAVIDATHATLAEFPDRQLLGEDVIWSGDPEQGFLSSHRIFSTATHLGAGAFGEPTGTALRYRVIADCAAIGNQIYDEWLVRDLGAIARQLGYGSRRFAAMQIEAQGGPQHATLPLMTQTDPAPVYRGLGNDDPAGLAHEATLVAMLTGAGPDVEQAYDRAAQLELPGGEQGHGWADAARFWGRLRASFPDLDVEIHHRIGRHDADMAPRSALRWSATGTHAGEGAFGVPTGARVHIMGINHAELGPRGVRREYVVFDEVAIWKQILIHGGEIPSSAP